jgi:hypothetical protein
MKRTYYDPRNPASYGGIVRLAHAFRGKKKKADVIEWLQSQDTYTLHRPARKRFPRNSYIVFGPNELWQADLNDMRGLSQHNDGVNYLLTVIDVFSKRLYAEPLKRKSGAEVADAFERIFEEAGATPRCLQTDKGTEFTGSKTKDLFKLHDITYVTTQNPDVKAAVVERANRTLKTRMWRYLTYNNTHRYIDVLDNLVYAYNHSTHRSLGKRVRPIDVDIDDKELVFRVWRHMYSRVPQRHKPKFKPGDTVRIAREKGAFAKGYETNWSKELFVVNGEYGSFPKPLYTLRDLNGTVLIGRFYEQELQKVAAPTSNRLYEIDKILETRGRGRSTRYLVKWVGYGDEFNSWIPASEVKDIS